AKEKQCSSSGAAVVRSAVISVAACTNVDVVAVGCSAGVIIPGAVVVPWLVHSARPIGGVISALEVSVVITQYAGLIIQGGGSAADVSHLQCRAIGDCTTGQAALSGIVAADKYLRSAGHQLSRAGH